MNGSGARERVDLDRNSYRNNIVCQLHLGGLGWNLGIFLQLMVLSLSPLAARRTLVRRSQNLHRAASQPLSEEAHAHEPIR
jgi:hypothetical protein